MKKVAMYHQFKEAYYDFLYYPFYRYDSNYNFMHLFY